MQGEMEDQIVIYDNLFNEMQKRKLYDFVKVSRFILGYCDTNEIAHQAFPFLHSAYTEDDYERSGMPEFIKGTEIEKRLEGYTMERSTINLSVPGEVHFAHDHDNIVLLYYVNREWDDCWAGETMFYDRNKESIRFCSKFVPGRIILFDGNIPHALRPQSSAAPMYRFTYSIFYTKE
jgi:hypothetical protein